MVRWALILPLVLVGGLVAIGKAAPKEDRKEEAKKDEGKGRRLIDVDAFLAEYDRNKDGSLSKEEVPEWLRYNFARIDTNKDGKLSKSELEKGVAYLHQRRRPSDVVAVLVEMSDCDECCVEELQHVYETLRKLDTNKDGKIDTEELKAGRKQIVEERVKNVMGRLDANKDGKISKEEARGQVKEHFAELDKNQDGFVDREELLAAAMAKHEEEKKSGERREK